MLSIYLNLLKSFGCECVISSGLYSPKFVWVSNLDVYFFVTELCFIIL